jgi:ribose transport system ATP-binding protein
VSQLRAENITKRYGGIAALEDAHFVAEAGEVHALLGENGAGKSTLIKVLTGAVSPDAGTVLLGDKQVAFSNPREAAAAGLAAVFQELSLVPDLTVAQNIWFGREPLTPLRTVSSRALKRQTLELFESLEISGISPGALTSELTVGERQLVEIAKAISTTPSVLVLDEATSALSLRETEWLLKTAKGLAARGALVIFISHRLREVRDVADRVTLLRNGTTVGTYDMAGVSDDEIVTLMLGRRAGRLYPALDHHAPKDVILRTQDLRFGHRLAGIDLELRAGEIMGVGGLQGQGQLELFLALAGAIRGRGTIEVNGTKSNHRSPREALRSGIGLAFVPEDRKTQGLLLDKAVRENVTLTILDKLSRWGLMQRGHERKMVDRVIEEYKIVLNSSEQPVGSLSGGNQQKVVIAKFLLSDARILLLYDLTRGVDVGTKAEIFNLMVKLAKDGYALLFFSTDNEELIHMCHRVLVMSYGQQSALLSGDELSDEGILRASLSHISAEVSA